MDYRENMEEFYKFRALDKPREALACIEAAIAQVPDMDLLPKLSSFRRDTLKRVPREGRNWNPFRKRVSA